MFYFRKLKLKMQLKLKKSINTRIQEIEAADVSKFTTV